MKYNWYNVELDYLSLAAGEGLASIRFLTFRHKKAFDYL